MQGTQRRVSDIEAGQSCPFSKQASADGKCPYSKPDVKVEGGSEKKEKKEKKPRGGCPFMPSEGKRNPGLTHLEESFDTYFIGPLNYLLDTRGLWTLAFDAKEAKKGSIKERRKVFDAYPIYLKNTLFHDEENTKKLRTLEVANRFFVFDKFREKGNKYMNKKQFDEAIKYYERALGCFRWLEVVEVPEVESDEEPIDETLTQEEQKELKEQRDAAKQYRKEQKDLKKQYASLMTVYTDENVKHRGPWDIEDNADKDLANSMLFSLYLNMGVCYMQMSHFQLARSVYKDAADITADNSQLLFRQSQAILYDKWSSLKDLNEAKKIIEKCIDLSNYEKIFKQEPGILRLMGLENAKQIYVEQAHKVMDKIKEKQKQITEIVEPLFERALEIEEIEKEMIEDGKNPYEEGVSDVIDPEDDPNIQEEPKQKLYRLCMPQLSQEHQEYEIIKEMVNKYYRIIEFYAEQKKDDQVKIAKKELQRLMETVQQMHTYMNLDFIDYQNHEVISELQKKYNIDLTDKKFIRRLCHLCREQVTEIFGQGKFNFEVFEYAMNDYFKKKREQEEREKQRYQEEHPEAVKPKKESEFLQKTLFSTEFWMQMVILVLVMGGIYYFNNSAVGSVFQITK